MDSELLMKFIGYFPDIVAHAFTLFWTTFVETAVYEMIDRAELIINLISNERGCNICFIKKNK